MPDIRVARFYKQDHGGDPVLLPDGRIRLGGQECKYYLRSGIKQADLDRRDNVIVAIGGITAEDGLRDRLTWGGIPIERQDDGSIVCEEGFILLQNGPLHWREKFPTLAEYVNTVTQGHRVGRLQRLKGERPTKTPLAVCQDLIRLFHWGKVLAPTTRSPAGWRRGACPPPICPPRPICPTPKKPGGRCR